MGNDFVNPDEWGAWGYWIKNDTANAQRRIAKKLYRLHTYVTKVPCCIDFKVLRGYLYLPFGGGLWNRFVNLMVTEIEMANDRHFGQWAQNQTDNMRREWSLSGLGRFRPTDRRDHIRYELDTQDIPDDEMETQPLHVLRPPTVPHAPRGAD